MAACQTVTDDCHKKPVSMEITDMPQEERPIGIFDSGVGGLSVVRALHLLVPREDIIYLGDTARLPYGTKSPKTVVRFSCEDAEFLLRHRVKALIAACGTVSAWALEALQNRFEVPVIGVIEPGVQAALKTTRNHRFGVMATNATVRSMAYPRAIHRACEAAKVFTCACPLLIPLVEAGWTNHRVTRMVLREYLAPLRRQRIDTLILACTHFPLLTAAIHEVVNHRVALVDCAEACARYSSEYLGKWQLLCRKRRRPGMIQAFVTDESDRFNELAAQFLGKSIAPAMQVDLPASPGRRGLKLPAWVSGPR
ncbi:MAG: glutamate racemase [Candidatus Omnitrophica bacterium]|nr:glutamate racemase [Candidatus Omnitrophota bacterium]